MHKLGWPTWPQWRQLPKVLTRKERFFIVALALGAVASGASWLGASYIERTEAVPDEGGSYTEAVVGEPEFINPLLAGVNDVDRDLIALVYSGLMKYDVHGNIVPDLAERYEISEDGKEYAFTLREDAQWHDGKPFGADDVIFTISAILNEDYGSPLRAGWQGITVEKVSDHAVKILLPKPYSQFIDRATVGILPKHVWENINPKNIHLADANQRPIGTGPYRFSKFTKDRLGNIVSYTLTAHEKFFGGTPFIQTLTFFFFPYEDEAIAAYRRGDVMAIGNVTPRERDRAEKRKSVTYALHIPKYFAVFFNISKSKPLVDKNVRMALAAATDKNDMIQKVLGGNGVPIDSSIFPWMAGYNEKVVQREFSIERAKEILEQVGRKDGDGDGIREKTIAGDKEPTPLEIALATSDFPDLVQAAELLKASWEQLGARIRLDIRDVEELKQRTIKPRFFEALLFGEALTLTPDLYFFWHSSQKKDPGLNLSLFDHKEVDRLLESVRESLNPEERMGNLQKVQEIISEELPVLFLYSPFYLFIVDRDVKNITVSVINIPARRFSGIEEWYIKTKRIEKTH